MIKKIACCDAVQGFDALGTASIGHGGRAAE